MPTFTAIALESLLEPNTTNSSPKQLLFPFKQPTPHNDHADAHAHVHAGKYANILRLPAIIATKKPSPPIHYISPALYATPQPASIPTSSPTSVSPSPYIVNHKRRDIRPAAPAPVLSETVNRLNGFHIVPKHDHEVGDAGSTLGTSTTHLAKPLVEVAVGGEANGRGKEPEQGNFLDVQYISSGLANGGDGLLREACLDVDNDNNDDDDDFFDPRESMSAVSSSDTEDGCTVVKRMPLRNRSEFYDVAEDFLSDGSISQSSYFQPNIEADLCAVRLNLFEEIERRKKVEEALDLMYNQWQRMANYLSQMGLSVPWIQDGGKVQVEVDSAAQVCQEVVVARFVSEAVERGLARAKAEAAAEEVIESKNHEIARLRDRLQYYETMNREMSQRNQEVIELARRQRLKRKIRRRWLWSCVGVSVTVGASLLAYSYLPHAGKNPLPTTEQCSDSSWGGIESRGSQT